MQYLVPDPYLFLYPDLEPSVPLEQRKANEFILRLYDWIQVFEQKDRVVALSKDCIDALKVHPRSILNGKFLGDLLVLVESTSAVNVLIPTLGRLKHEQAFKDALKTIDRDKVEYRLDEVKVDPTDFQCRLPDDIHSAFLDMLGQLAFAKLQKWYPIEAFKKLAFPTYFEEDNKWLKTTIKVVYDTDFVDTKPLNSPCQNHMRILRDPSSEIETQPVRVPRTLGTVVERVKQQYPRDILISDQLQRRINKENSNLPNFSKVERVLFALAQVWLPTYRNQRLTVGDANARKHAHVKFYNSTSFEISGESKTVRSSASLNNHRKISYGADMDYAHMHVKINKFRVHFAVRKVDEEYRIILGHIGKHLPTARH